MKFKINKTGTGRLSSSLEEFRKKNRLNRGSYEGERVSENWMGEKIGKLIEKRYYS